MTEPIAMTLPAGTNLGPYVIVAPLGAGGMGVVYRARDPRLQRDVALKVLAPADAEDEQARSRLLREARSAATLNHPNICVVHDVGEADGRVFIAMECIEGTSIDGLIRRGPLAVEQIAELGVQIAGALGHAHRAGIVHRDLKSSNIMLAGDGRAKVLDFGLAVRSSSDVTASTRSAEWSAPAGTLAYMAPEILRGSTHATAQSDIWSLGVILHEMAAGARPFDGATGFDLTSSILRDNPRLLPSDVPPQLATVIRRCLIKDPRKRFTTMDEVRAALEVAALPVRDDVPRPLPLRARAVRRRRLALAGGILFGIVAVSLAIAWYRTFGPGSANSGPIRTLAVLPFENLSGDPSQNFFSEGMTDEVTTALAGIGALTVISRTSAIQVRDVHVPLAEIGRRLKVQAVVEGSVLRAGDRVRINVKILEVQSDRHLWAQSFERDYRDVLALQSDIARAVAQQVRATLTPSTEARLSGARRVNPQAYDKYLLGRHFVRQRNADAAERGLEYLRQAANLDPDSAIIHAGLAEAYQERDTWAGFRIGTSAKLMRAEALRAIELDSALPEAHLALASVHYWVDWDWPGGEREYRSALELNPSLGAAHMGYALLLQTIGRNSEAVAAGRRATELEPLSASVFSDYGRILYRARLYDEATARFNDALRFEPGMVAALYRLFDTQRVRGDRVGLRETAAKLGGAGASVPAQSLRYIRAVEAVAAGRPEEARIIALQIEKAIAGERPGEYAFGLGAIYAGLGDTERALGWLETGIRERSMFPLQLRDPVLAAVEQHQRMVALRRSLKMP